MGATKDLFLRISEPDYMQIPQHIRERHLAHTIYSESVNDHNELMKDIDYARLHEDIQRQKKFLEERKYQLREKKRKDENLLS